jgi:hypothetical protein
MSDIAQIASVLYGYLGGQSSLPLSTIVSELQQADLVPKPTSGTSGLSANTVTQQIVKPAPYSPTWFPAAGPLGLGSALSLYKNPSAELTPYPVSTTNGQVLDPGLSFNKSTGFSVAYVDSTGTPQTYYFSLLPAIETNFRAHIIRDVPRVRPGISIKQQMNLKRFMIPGSFPVYQPLGIEDTLLTLVGLFVGTEGSTPTSPDSVLYGSPGNFPALRTPSALSTAQSFQDQVVNANREVTVTINVGSLTSNYNEELRYTGLIKLFDLFLVRTDRVFYEIQLLLTKNNSMVLGTNYPSLTISTSVSRPTSSPTSAPGT